MRPLSIRIQLALLVFLVALPAAGLLTWSALRLRQEALERARTETQQLAESIADQQQTVQTSVEQLLVALAQLPQVRGRDPEVGGVLAQFVRVNPWLLNLVVADRGGVVWAWAAGNGSALVADRRFFANALATGGLASGEWVYSRWTGKPTFHFAYPFRDGGGEVAGVIGAAIDLGASRPLLAHAHLPEGTNYALLDRNGVIMSSGLEKEPSAGRPVPAELFAIMRAGPDQATQVGRGIAGDARVVTWQKLRLPGEPDPYLYVWVGVPVEAALREARPAVARNLLAFAVLLLVALAGIWYLGKRAIADRVSLLEEASRRLATGDLSGRVSDLVRGGELGDLARTFDEMAAQLGERTRALARSERRYREIFDGTEEAIFVHDAVTGRIVDANRVVEQLYGYSREELVQLSLAALSAGAPPWSDVEATRWLHRAIEEGPQRFEWWARRRDGSHFWAEVGLSASMVAGEGRVLATVRDVTARRAAEEENRTLQERLAQAERLQAVGRLAGGVAHDTNNMLSVVLGEVELLREALPPGHPGLEGVAEIEQAAVRTRDITRQLLAFCRRQVVAPRPVDLNARVEATRPTLARLLRGDIRIDFSPAPGLWTVRIDPIHVDQVLVNLVVNARDAMPGGGTLRVELRNVEHPGQGGRAALAPGRYVRLAVTDSGEGMDEETLAHVFEPFFTRKAPGRGTGLGLATVYGIASQSGGCVVAESRLGQGSTFSLYLPAWDGPLEDPSPVVPAPVPRGVEHVLLVEDDALVRGTTYRMLESLGYAVRLAASPDEALRICEREAVAFDLVVSDVVMPGMNGPELLRRIAELRPGVRALLVSGYADDAMAAEGLRVEAEGFLQKPFSLAELGEKVRRAVAGPAFVRPVDAAG